MSPAPKTLRVRWSVFAFMFAIGLVAYLQQKSLTIAADRMEPELGLSQLAIGWIRTAFLVAYAAFQLPAGLIGERFGARRTLVGAGLLSIVAVLAMPAAPLLLTGSALFAAMLLAQFMLGVSHAFVWPVSAGVLSRWFPSHRWALVLGLQTMGLGIGSMITPPLISQLMVNFGWQRAIALAALPAIPFVVLWGWYGRNTPAEHPAVSAAELAELDAPALGLTGADDPPTTGTLKSELWRLLGNRQVLVLSFSYLCMNYLFYLLGDWVFLYLRQERHFSIVDSGWLASLPPTLAAIGAGVGGAVGTMLCVRLGPRWGLATVGIVALPLAGLLLLVAISTASPTLAVAALTAAYGAIELTEGPYWAAAMSAGGRNTMAIGGVLNTGGNLGGVITTPIVGFLSGIGHWDFAFYLGAVFALAGTAAWFLVGDGPRDARRR
jgi:MFS transporter, ACS family, glucarate transporter